MPKGPVSGAGLLRVVQRFMQSGMAMALCVTRIAQRKLMGEDLGRLAPAGFDPTLTNAFVVQAVGLTAALRHRLRALVGRPVAPLVPGVPKPARAPRGRSKPQLVTVTYETTPGDPHNWPALAQQQVRVGRVGVATALEKIAGRSDREVVTDICDFLRRAAGQLGAEADMARIAALEAAAMALCPEAAAAEDGSAKSGGAKSGGAKSGGAESASSVLEARSPPAGPASEAKDDPLPEPPDTA